MSSSTTVNAGFSRRSAQYGHAREWVNVQRILVPLPAARLGSKPFRDLVRQQHPPGTGWVLEGYCVADEGASAPVLAQDHQPPVLVDAPAPQQLQRLGLDGGAGGAEAAERVVMAGAEVVHQRLVADGALHAPAVAQLGGEAHHLPAAGVQLVVQEGGAEAAADVVVHAHAPVDAAPPHAQADAHSIGPASLLVPTLRLDMDEVVRQALQGKHDAEGPRGSHGCACLDRDAVQCAAIRYGMDHFGEPCICLCHQWPDED